jgi:hypothetical protein
MHRLRIPDKNPGMIKWDGRWFVASRELLGRCNDRISWKHPALPFDELLPHFCPSKFLLNCPEVVANDSFRAKPGGIRSPGATLVHFVGIIFKNIGVFRECFTIFDI